MTVLRCYWVDFNIFGCFVTPLEYAFLYFYYYSHWRDSSRLLCDSGRLLSDNKYYQVTVPISEVSPQEIIKIVYKNTIFHVDRSPSLLARFF